MTYICPLRKKLSKELDGNKALSLAFLLKNHFRIPETYLISPGANELYLTDPAGIISELRKELSLLPDYNYIVRSSTSLEDSENFSHAGQFKSISNIKGTENLLQAIEDIWNSAIKQEHYDYRAIASHGSNGYKFALILQRMIPSKMAGVSFSKNPVNGQNEIIIEALEGPGEELMQKGFEPLRWRIRKDKIHEGSENHHFIGIIKEVAKSTIKLKKIYGKHIDIEWVYDGSQVYYVQMRSITANREMAVYSNKMAQEMLPGQIKPLVWSVNIPMVNGTWINLLSKITGPLDVKPEDLARPFYYRTYFNMAALGKIFKEFGVPLESLENMMLNEKNTRHSFKPGLKTIRHTFRIIRFITFMFRFEKFYLKEYKDLAASYGSLQTKLRDNFSIVAYPALFGELLYEGRRLTFLNIVTPLLMRIHNKRLSKKLKRINIDYDRLIFSHDFPELDELSPLSEIEKISQDINSLDTETRNKCFSFRELNKITEASHIKDHIDRFISKFGHFSQSGNDFSYPKWEEDPEYIYKMIINHTQPDRRQNPVLFSDLKYSRLRHPGLGSAYFKAGRFKVYREQISSLYIFGYGLFRAVFLNLADEFLSSGILSDKEDIFYLTRPEIDKIIKEKEEQTIDHYRKLIRERRTGMEESKDLFLPPVIYGDVAPILEKGDIKNFRGTGTSSGSYTGRAKIIRETGDFDKVERGDVVIIPFSDVSWTPVLCKAGAIVAESGGMLSHCSIIAREMGIPAMVSVDNACALSDNITVTVDGSNSILTVHHYE